MRSSMTRRLVVVAATVMTAAATTVGLRARVERRPRSGGADYPTSPRRGANGRGRARLAASGSAQAAAAGRVATASSAPGYVAPGRVAGQGGRPADGCDDRHSPARRPARRLPDRARAAPGRPTVAMGFVRAPPRRARPARVRPRARLHLARDYRDVAGTHHLSWTQSAQGIPVFSNGLQAAVSRTGRLLMIGGAPVSDLHVPASATAGTQRVTSARAAIAKARTSVGEPAAAGPADTAGRVLFVTAHGTYLGLAGGHDVGQQPGYDRRRRRRADASSTAAASPRTPRPRPTQPAPEADAGHRHRLPVLPRAQADAAARPIR